MDIKELRKIAESGVKLNGRFTNAAVSNSNCECGDSDGCDGDCGGDCFMDNTG